MAGTSPYDLFETDQDVERHGIELDYGPFYITVARAGGGNDKFRDTLRRRMQPHKRALATETMNEELAETISIDVFAETVVVGWGSKEHGEGKLEGRGGDILDFSAEAVKALFKDLPDLARDVMQQAQSAANFRKANAEDDAGN